MRACDPLGDLRHRDQPWRERTDRGGVVDRRGPRGEASSRPRREKKRPGTSRRRGVRGDRSRGLGATRPSRTSRPQRRTPGTSPAERRTRRRRRPGTDRRPSAERSWPDSSAESACSNRLAWTRSTPFAHSSIVFALCCSAIGLRHHRRVHLGELVRLAADRLRGGSRASSRRRPCSGGARARGSSRPRRPRGRASRSARSLPSRPSSRRRGTSGSPGSLRRTRPSGSPRCSASGLPLERSPVLPGGPASPPRRRSDFRDG